MYTALSKGSTMTTIERPAQATTSFLWLEITGRCQLACSHCYADSGLEGTHGTMSTADWVRVIDEAAELGVGFVQFIGGEPTLHPDLPELVRHAVSRELRVEVFTNLVHVTPELWAVFELPGVRLATSYYSDDPGEHAAITGRPSHARTKANIAEALLRGIELRVGVIHLGGGQRVEQAKAELAELGVSRVDYDRVRGVGRAAFGESSADQLCGGCGDGVAAVRPNGTVSPCVMARWMSTGTAREQPLAEAVAGIPAARAELAEQGMPGRAATLCGPDCAPKGEECWPTNCDPRY